MKIQIKDQETRITVYKLKDTLDGINYRLDISEEKEHEDIKKKKKHYPRGNKVKKKKEKIKK